MILSKITLWHYQRFQVSEEWLLYNQKHMCGNVFCFRQFVLSNKFCLVMVAGRSSMYPKSKHSKLELSTSILKCRSRIECWRRSFNSYCNTPSNISCITSGSNALVTLKYCNSFKMLPWLMPYSIDLWPLESSSISSHWILYSARERSSNFSSLNYKNKVIFESKEIV